MLMQYRPPNRGLIIMAKCTPTQKIRYKDQMEAELALADIHRSNSHHHRRKYREEPVRSYLCGACKGWHLTSMTQEEYESRRTVSH